jgi:nucleoside-diphosphate-sugar epimerase
MNNPKKNYHVYASGRNRERAISRFSSYKDSPFFHFIKYDVMEEIDSEVDFHYIIHAASNASPNFFVSNPVEIIKANIWGVDNLMQYGMKHGLKRFLFVSSGEIYGQGDGRKFTEEYSGYVDCLLTRSCYPSSKRAAENLCVAYSAEYGIESVIARPCHIYGPNFTESDNRAYAQFIRNVLNGQNIVLKSTGEQFRSWCYVVDCVSALLYILLKGENQNAYNIADESSNISIRSLAESIARIGNVNVVFDLPSDTEIRGFNKVTKSIYDTSRLKALGWLPFVHIEEGLFHTIEHISILNKKNL